MADAAPAATSSNVGVAMGAAGSDVALETADIAYRLLLLKGADPGLNPMMAPTNGLKTQEGSMLLFVGGNFYIPSGILNARLGIEAGLPVYQLEGIQMKQTWFFTAGIRYSFGGHKH